MSKDADIAVMIVIIICCFLFFMEIILNCYARANYVCSFYFVLDVLGTCSLIVDIIQLHSGSGISVRTLVQTKVGRVARLAGSLRFSRTSRIFRVIRMVRVTRFFTFVQRGNNADDDVIGDEPTPSKLGRLLSDRVRIYVLLYFYMSLTILRGLYFLHRLTKELFPLLFC
jgi:hypothetical protein